jgi:hypothetical protein
MIASAVATRRGRVVRMRFRGQRGVPLTPGYTHAVATRLGRVVRMRFRGQRGVPLTPGYTHAVATRLGRVVRVRFGGQRGVPAEYRSPPATLMPSRRDEGAESRYW